MGLSAQSARFLFDAKRAGANFEKTLMLGRQRVYADPEVFDYHLRRYSETLPYRDIDELIDKEGYTEPFFRFLGAETIQALDASAYEASALVHDLNEPIPDAYCNRYTLIFDGGTLEHVFNFPVAIRNCMEMLEVGGYYIGATPSNNLCGHGFYQFSPEVMFRVFSEENGFEVERMVLSEESAEGRWYEVRDPGKLGRRSEVVNAFPTYLLIRARKVREANIFASNPQQSNYVHRWAVSNEDKVGKQAPEYDSLRYRLMKTVRLKAPNWVRGVYRHVAGLGALKDVTKRDRKMYRRVS